MDENKEKEAGIGLILRNVGWRWIQTQNVRVEGNRTYHQPLQIVLVDLLHTRDFL